MQIQQLVVNSMEIKDIIKQIEKLDL